MVPCTCKAIVREMGSTGPFFMREFVVPIANVEVTGPGHAALHAELIAGIREQGFQIQRLVSHRHKINGGQ